MKTLSKSSSRGGNADVAIQPHSTLKSWIATLPMVARNDAKIICFFLAITLLSGCSYMPEWMGADEETHLEGKRLAILPERQVLAANPEIKDTAVAVPDARANTAWYQGKAVSGDGASLDHVSLNGNLKKETSFSDGNSPDEDVRLTSAPIVIGNMVVLLDGQGKLSATQLSNLDKTIWQVDLKQLATEEHSASGRESGLMNWFDSDEDFIGGNIAFVEGKVIATTGNGHVFAFDLANGKLSWHRSMGISIQSAPSGRNGNVYFITSDNQLYALSLENGLTQWTHNGVPQQTKILGAPAPVPLSEAVIVPYSSGELVALKQVNGLKLWEENLDADPHSGALAFRFSDIVAAPVIHEGRVFASAEGHLVALDTMTGNRIWELPITLSSTPWAAGDWLFGITNQEELVAIHATDGKIRWVTPLPQYGDPDSKEDRIRWNGPVLAGGQLIVAGSRGELKTFAFEDGALKNTRKVSDNILLPPVVANGKLFLLNNDADLSVLE